MAKEIVLVLGVTLVILAIVGRVKTPHFEVGVVSVRKRTLLGILGAALAAAFFAGDVARAWAQWSPRPSAAMVEVELLDAEALDPDAKYVATKVHRNLAELLNNVGHRVIAPPLSVAPSTTANAEPKRLVVKVVKEARDVSVQVDLQRSDRTLLARTELVGDLGHVKEIYKVIPEALLYGLDVEERSLAKKQSARRPTENVAAYADYLFARRKLQAGDADAAQASLQRAIATDPRFAMAHWALGKLLGSRGKDADGAAHIQQALRIDKDHPRIALATEAHKSDPVPDLMSELRKSSWKEIDRGLSFKQGASTITGVHVRVWAVDPKILDVGLAEQKGPHGSTAEDFLFQPKAVLALNGGFFEIGESQRLTGC